MTVVDTAAAISHHRNERLPRAPETEELLRLFDEDRLDELREQTEQELAIENAAHALRDLEERRQAALMPADGLEAEAEKLAEEYREVVASVRNTPTRQPRIEWTLPDPVETAEADGAFQWSTTTLLPMPGNFEVTARPEGGYYFTGSRTSIDVGLSFNVLLRAHFVLGREQLPPSPAGRWATNPSVDLRGNVWAETQRGSTAAECTLSRTQTLFQINGGQTEYLGSRHEESVLVRSYSLNSKRALLAGLYSMPGFDFAPAYDKPIWATLEVRFFGTVRGRGSEVTIGTRPPEDGVVVQFPPWRPIPY